jgi:hypothetical protein
MARAFSIDLEIGIEVYFLPYFGFSILPASISTSARKNPYRGRYGHYHDSPPLDRAKETIYHRRSSETVREVIWVITFIGTLMITLMITLTHSLIILLLV